MSDETGWVKIHRCMTKWGWYTDLPVFKLFMHLILTANHVPRTWKGIEIKRGERIASLEILATETGLSVRQIRTALTKLKSTKEVTHETTRQFSRLSVCNYDTYQSREDPSDTRSDTRSDKRETNERQTSDNKQECKKDKKGRTEAVCSEQSSSPPEIDFPLSSGKLWRLPLEVWWTLETTYPDVKLRQACMEALAWLRANPKKRKTPRGMATFLTSWVQREAKDARVAKESGAVVRFPRAASPETEPGREAFRMMCGDFGDEADKVFEQMTGVRR